MACVAPIKIQQPVVAPAHHQDSGPSRDMRPYDLAQVLDQLAIRVVLRGAHAVATGAGELFQPIEGCLHLVELQGDVLLDLLEGLLAAEPSIALAIGRRAPDGHSFRIAPAGEAVALSRRLATGDPRALQAADHRLQR